MREGRKVEELANSEKQQIDKKSIKSTLKKNNPTTRNTTNDLRDEGKGAEQSLETYSNTTLTQK